MKEKILVIYDCILVFNSTFAISTSAKHFKNVQMTNGQQSHKGLQYKWVKRFTSNLISNTIYSFAQPPISRRLFKETYNAIVLTEPKYNILKKLKDENGQRRARKCGYIHLH